MQPPSRLLVAYFQVPLRSGAYIRRRLSRACKNVWKTTLERFSITNNLSLGQDLSRFVSEKQGWLYELPRFPSDQAPRGIVPLRWWLSGLGRRDPGMSAMRSSFRLPLGPVPKFFHFKGRALVGRCLKKKIQHSLRCFAQAAYPADAGVRARVCVAYFPPPVVSSP